MERLAPTLSSDIVASFRAIGEQAVQNPTLVVEQEAVLIRDLLSVMSPNWPRRRVTSASAIKHGREAQYSIQHILRDGIAAVVWNASVASVSSGLDQGFARGCPALKGAGTCRSRTIQGCPWA
jgi:hypothetical protein